MEFIKRKLRFNLILSVLLLVGFFTTVSAFITSSDNYRLQSDSLNTGGQLSTSPSYQIEDTTGEIGTGIASSTTYGVLAGYEQMQEVSLALTSASDIVMTPLTLTQNTSVGNTEWTVITDSPAGYSATIYATVSDVCGDRDGGGATDALCDLSTTESFADISTARHQWNVSNEYAFGYSAYGDDVSGYGTDTNCIIGENVPSDSLLWQGFHSTTAYQIASSTARTEPIGTVTTMCVATEQDTVFASSGAYYATTTITVLTL